MTGDIIVVEPHQRNKISLFAQYKTLKISTPSKFEKWIMSVDERWIGEISACIQGEFPDWRG